jgi:GTP pyrophosphokinase
MAEFTEQEEKDIVIEFEKIFANCKGCQEEENKELLTKAFDLARKAHYGTRRRSGEPYIIHPLQVAQIATTEIGLGTKSAICAILHDVVEDTEYTLEDIRNLFGDKITMIIDGLTKISSANSISLQAENFKKMLLTLSDDVRVILIKLADRLHNMRTLESMPEVKQQIIATETSTIYSPLAHRLGLYGIKTELEDLSLKYQQPKIFEDINNKILASEKQRIHYINKFSLPIINKLVEKNIKFEVTGRPKSVFSIWNKIRTKDVTFEEVYDLFAVRIIFKEEHVEDEKTQCWNIYSLVTDIYQPKPDRLRDWVSTPKENGYEALHTTVMGPEGKWVEVQIRSERMNDIAERGYAAHWKYKGTKDTESELDKWIKKIQGLLENPESDALAFLDEFKMNLYSSEIFVFTPKGELKRLPKHATALDYAYEIHSEVGNRAIGAKINYKLVGLNYKLQSGDQIEILTSEKQKPERDWVDFVITAKAKAKIKDYFKQDRKESIKKGKELLDEKLKELELVANSYVFRKLLKGYNIHSKDELYCKIGIGVIQLAGIKKIIQKKSKNKWIRYWGLQLKKTTTTTKKKTKSEDNKKINKKETLHISDNLTEFEYIIADCCNPIPGDDVIGYINDDYKVEIHNRKCNKAETLMSNFKDKIVSAEWKSHKVFAFLASISLTGIDKKGIIYEISKLISSELNANIRSISIDSSNGVFHGNIDLYIYNTTDLEQLISDLKKIKGIKTVNRTVINS